MNARNELTTLILGKTAPRAADAILAAGYSKPRTITTAEELDALPVGVVVGDSSGFVYEKYPDDERREFDFWLTIGESRPQPSKRISLPATVLHEPEATK